MLASVPVAPQSSSFISIGSDGGGSKGAVMQRRDAAVKGRKSAVLVSGERASLRAVKKIN